MIKLKYIGKYKETYVKAGKQFLGIKVVPGEIIEVKEELVPFLLETQKFELVKNKKEDKLNVGGGT